MITRPRLLAATGIALLAVALGGCRSKGDIVVDEGVGISAVRGACPAVGVPDYTGDVTLFRTPGATDAGSIDLAAAITNLRPACDEKATGDKVWSQTSFDVLARRTDARGARTVQLPWFVTVLRGGNAVVSKRVGTVTLNFADGQERAQAHAEAGAYIDRAEATLPEDIRHRITRKRKAGEADAAIDPLAQPDVRAAVARATFEVLVGFQLTEQQLAYNATR
ncbi:hypothetical protein ACFOD9_03540 [Novosphingobium bradum]|uniref:Uncharacterized protein n=1 Tax=Novosphingobium bradum TaxID=1737444 RepID=A0ABV7IP00_9SPHN